MQRDKADHVVVQQRGGLADRLIGPHRRGAIQQQVVGHDAQRTGPFAVMRDAASTRRASDSRMAGCEDG